MSLQVWNKRVLGADDLIGRGTVLLGSFKGLLGAPPQEAFPSWHDLEPEGVLKLSLQVARGERVEDDGALLSTLRRISQEAGTRLGVLGALLDTAAAGQEEGAQAGSAPARAAPAWSLKIRVCSATELSSTQTIGQQSPYVVVKTVDQECRTGTVDGGGTDPEWPPARSAFLEFEFTEATPQGSLNIGVYGEAAFGDSLIGSCTVEVENLHTQLSHKH